MDSDQDPGKAARKVVFVQPDASTPKTPARLVRKSSTNQSLPEDEAHDDDADHHWLFLAHRSMKPMVITVVGVLQLLVAGRYRGERQPLARSSLTAIL